MSQYLFLDKSPDFCTEKTFFRNVLRIIPNNVIYSGRVYLIQELKEQI